MFIFLKRSPTRYADPADSSDNGQHLEKWRSWSQVKEPMVWKYTYIHYKFNKVFIDLFGVSSVIILCFINKTECFMNTLVFKVLIL